LAEPGDVRRVLLRRHRPRPRGALPGLDDARHPLPRRRRALSPPNAAPRSEHAGTAVLADRGTRLRDAWRRAAPVPAGRCRTSLWSRAMAGSPATTVLAAVERCRRRLWAHCYRMTGRRSDADDLSQEAIARAIERAGELHDPAAVEGWLFRIATTECLDHLRRQRHRH